MRTAALALVCTATLGCMGYLGSVLGSYAGGAAVGTDAAPPSEPAPSTAQARLAEWSGCMTLENWQASGMSSWPYKVTEGATVCSSCHADGLGRVNTNPHGDEMLTMNRYEVFIGGFFAVTSDGGALDVVPAYDKLAAVGGGLEDHPTFAVGQGDQAFQALETFYQATRAARDSGACAPPGFPTE